MRSLKQLREQRGWNQADLARHTKIPQSNLSKHERGEKMLKPAYHPAVALALDLDLATVTEALEGEYNPQKKTTPYYLHIDFYFDDPGVTKAKILYSLPDPEAAGGLVPDAINIFGRMIARELNQQQMIAELEQAEAALKPEPETWKQALQQDLFNESEIPT